MLSCNMITFANALRLGFYKNSTYLTDFLEKEQLPDILTTSEVVTLLKVLLPLGDERWNDFIKDVLSNKTINHWYDVNVSIYVLEKIHSLGITNFASLNAFNDSNQKNEIIFQHIKQTKNKETFTFYCRMNVLEDPYLQLKILSLYKSSDEMVNVLIRNVVDKLKNGVQMKDVEFDMSLAWASLIGHTNTPDDNHFVQESEIFFG